MAPDMTAAVILAGGQGTRLSVLSKRRAKPGVPFGGIYRIIDFVLSNLMHSRIERVGLLTQYRPGSLLEHVATGASWDFVGRSRVLDVLPPHQGRRGSDWYQATADAVYQNLAWLRRTAASRCLILSGDHIYSMDYRKLVNYHLSRRADVTLAVKRMPPEELSQFGIVLTEGDGRITGFQEKPKEPRSDLVNLGIYVFETEVLVRALLEDSSLNESEHDFGKNIIPSLLQRARVMAYPFDGYWKDVGTIGAFLEANMRLCDRDSELDISKWQVATNWERQIGTRIPARVGPGAITRKAVLSPGVVVSGEVRRSVLSPGVIVDAGACVENSVLMHDVRVRSGAQLTNVVVDKDVDIGGGAVVGGMSTQVASNADFPSYLNSGISLIGKGAQIPAGCHIGQNCLIADGMKVAVDTLGDGQSIVR